MPLASPIVLSILQPALLANGIAGPYSAFLATGIAQGFSRYIQGVTPFGPGVIVQTIDTGTAGAGKGTGIGIFLEAPILSLDFRSTFTANGINGTMREPLINAISFTFSTVLKTAIINTVNGGVGVGAGKVSLTPNPLASVPNMILGFVGAALTGTSSASLATAIAQGFDQSLPKATGVIAIAGPPSPTAATGVGAGLLT